MLKEENCKKESKEKRTKSIKKYEKLGKSNKLP